jgi:DNA-binding transcriptional regulator YhcF (GntR family)
MSKEFKGVWIPKEIYLRKGLTPTDKLVFADIFNLCTSKSEYFKANDTIAKEIGASARTVQRSIQKLEKCGFITKGFNGRSRTIWLCSMDKMSSSKDNMTSQDRQYDQAATSKWRTSIQESIQEKEHISKGSDIIYPYESEQFLNTWETWLQERKEKKLRKYTHRGEQAALHNLLEISDQSEQKAIKIINQSITHGWQGLFALKEQKRRTPEIKITQSTIDWLNSSR